MTTDAAVAWYEDIVDTCTEATIDEVHAQLAQFGLLPFGYTRGTREQRLEQYLAIRDNLEDWRAMVGVNAQTVGWDAALARAMAEANQLERQMARLGGADAVRALLAERLIRDARPALREAARVRAKPPVQVLPPLPPGDEVELIQSWIETATAPLTPVTDIAAGVTPPPPRTFPTPAGVRTPTDVPIVA